MLDLATATLASFAPHVGTAFALNHPEQDETFTLVQVEPIKPSGLAEARSEPFSLIFDGGRTDIRFDQQVLPLRHPAIGDMAMFLVPIARNPEGTIRYQAVFS